MVVLEQKAQDGKEMKRQDNAETGRPLRSAGRRRRIGRTPRRLPLTTPDLVLLSLLAERPMHGYQANLELERREIRDWAGISRPQVYYSLEKLARAGLIHASETDEPAAGPERSTFATTAKGRAALARPASVPDLDRPFVAGAAGRLPESVEAEAEIFAERNRERKENSAVDLRRGRSQVSRSGMDGGLNDRADASGSAMDAAIGARVSAKGAGALSAVRGRIAQVKLRGPAKNPEYAKGE